MSESITVNMDNLSAGERATMMELVKKANKVESKVWKPKMAEDYWVIGSDENCISTWDNDSYDNGYYAMGNCFKTEKEAEFAREKLEVTTELQRYAEGHNEKIDWKDFGSAKYFICYNYMTEDLGISFNDGYKQNNIYFSSEKIAEDAIKAIGEGRIKKYYLGVVED